MSYGHPTIRRYPRTLAQAFPSAEDCVAITCYSAPLRRLLARSLWLALCVLIGALLVKGL